MTQSSVRIMATRRPSLSLATAGSLNFIPQMNSQKLVSGYKRILRTIYEPRAYYERVKTLLQEYHLPLKKPLKLTWRDFRALMRSVVVIGLLDKGKRYYWRLVFFSLFRCPQRRACA